MCACHLSLSLFLCACRGFQEKPEGKYEFRFKGPSLELVGPYSINGRILILPIQGVGDSNITMSNNERNFYLCFDAYLNQLICDLFSEFFSKSRHVRPFHWEVGDAKWQRVFETRKDQIIVYNDEADIFFGEFVQWRQGARRQYQSLFEWKLEGSVPGN